MKRVFTIQWLCLCAALLLISCSQDAVPDVAPAACVPVCEGRQCGDNGCGGICGACGDGDQCSAAGMCLSPSQIIDEPEPCEGEQCGCVPICSAATCELADGCGGACGLCTSVESCPDCALRLSLVETQTHNDIVRSVTLAVDFNPGSDDPHPGIADIRLTVTGPGQLKSVGLSPTVLDAGKELFVDPNTGKPFRVLADGTHQVLIFSTANTQTIPGGRWLFLKFTYDKAFATSPEPSVIQLVDREQIFAPPDADAVLWGTSLETPVVIWPQAVTDE